MAQPMALAKFRSNGGALTILALLFACTAPAPAKHGGDGDPAHPTAATDRTTVALRVACDDTALRALVDATLRAQIEAERGLALVNRPARLRVEVKASRRPPAGGATGDDVALEFHVFDVGDADDAADADERRDDESILGGVVPCRTETLDATCTAVVQDLGKFAQMERDFESRMGERTRQQLKAGETDLIDDDEVRYGDR